MVTALDVAAAAARPDPELPMLTVADLGILRAVDVTAGGVTVTITPTYSGCPAMREISADVRHRLRRPDSARSPCGRSWPRPGPATGSPREGRRKLAAAGIAPPSPAARRTGPIPLTLALSGFAAVPAVRFAPHPADGGVQRHGVQVTAPVPGLRGTVRGGQSPMRADFHPLVVARVEPLTDDSAAITFRVPGDLADVFAFAPGQSLTLRRGDERRSYSICAAAGSAPRIGVREVAGGAVSGWLVRELKAGDTVEVQVPSGTFTPDLTVPAQHVLSRPAPASPR